MPDIVTVEVIVQTQIATVEVAVSNLISTVEVIGPVIVSNSGGSFVGNPVFIGNIPPVGQTTNYAWFDTSGGNLTLWIEGAL